jgi:molybdopterin molybdotransferase
MVVFEIVVRPFVEHIGGLSPEHKRHFRPVAQLTRNISSTQGRVDYLRVKLIETDGILWAEPILGKSGLINTMVKADGLIEIGLNTEGLDRGEKIKVIPL